MNIVTAIQYHRKMASSQTKPRQGISLPSVIAKPALTTFMPGNTGNSMARALHCRRSDRCIRQWRARPLPETLNKANHIRPHRPIPNPIFHLPDLRRNDNVDTELFVVSVPFLSFLCLIQFAVPSTLAPGHAKQRQIPGPWIWITASVRYQL